MKRITNARVVTEDRIVPQTSVEVENGRIHGISYEPIEPMPDDIDLKGAWLLPGFLDIHVHAETPRPLSGLRDYVRELSVDLLAKGTTGILWTVGLDLDTRLDLSRAINALLAAPPNPCVVMGIHHEGPYLSPASSGAFRKEALCTPDEIPIEDIFDASGSSLKYISLAPDVPGTLDVIGKCLEHDVRVGMGHSLANAETVERAASAGAGSVIHTFNNTPKYPMKEPGVRGVTLDEYSMSLSTLMNELICDGIHVDPILVRALTRAKPRDRLMIITDSICGGRLYPEGYRIGREPNPIVIQGGVGRNERGGMCGSALTMERAFRNFIAFTGASMYDAVCATSLNAARFLGMDHERGRIAPGYRADFAVLDENLMPCMDRLSGLKE